MNQPKHWNTDARGDLLDPDAQGVVTYHDAAGRVAVFPSLRAAIASLGLNFLRDLRWRHPGWPEAGNGWGSRYWHCGPDGVEFCLRNEFGQLVCREAMEALRPPRVHYVSHRYAHPWNGMGAVPHTACRRGGHRAHRRPRTMNERRLHALVVGGDDEPPVRAARRPHCMPHAWDDIPRSAERSWKAQRKTQYKGKKSL